jgi:uncharacterized membrane protein
LEEEKMKKLLSLMALFVISLLTLSMVSALDANDLVISSVEVNGHDVDFLGGEVLAVEEGEIMEVEIGLEGTTNGAEDFEVEVEISGYEYDDYEELEDSTHIDNLQAGTTKYFDLEVQMPKKLDKDSYWLRVRVMDKNTAAITATVMLAVEPSRHGIDIKDVAFSPGNTVKAGRSLLTTVLLENYGDKTEKDVKVTVSMPELGIQATEYVDVVATDNHNIEYEDVPEMFLPIPATAVEGEYEVVVSAKYDDLRETVSETYTVLVMDNALLNDNCEKLVLALGPESQTVAAGKTGTYAIALTNAGTCSKAYNLEIVTGYWGTATLSESLVVLEPGQNRVVYAEVTVNAGTDAGQHVASLAVKAGDNLLETVVIKTNVVESGSSADNFSLRNGLEIALIVLVVLLVIIGLIIGFSRLRKDDNEEEQTYY